jgi:hypothetical protein
MAVQDFDIRPMRRTSGLRNSNAYTSVLLLFAAVAFIFYMLIALPMPAAQLPLAEVPLNQLSR